MRFVVPSIMRLTSSGLRTVGSFRGVFGNGRSSKCMSRRLSIFLKEEPQGRHCHLHRAGREFAFLQQVPLESLNLRGSQAVRRLTEILRELFGREDVAANCGW